ncbi:hypothetical protein CHUAL_007554 [Chamberlinius hualienensis]
MKIHRIFAGCLYLISWLVSHSYSRKERLFTIKPHLWSDQVLDIADLNPCADAEIIICPFKNRSSQYWELYNNTIIRNLYSGYVLDLKKNKNVIMWPATGSTTQQWLIFKENATQIRNWGGKCLSVFDKQNVPGTRVIVESCEEQQENQIFDFVYR